MVPMILILILTTLAITSVLVLTNWIRTDSASRFQTVMTRMEQRDQAYDELVRTLLGVPPVSPALTVTTSPPPETPKLPEPEELFDLFSGPMQEAMLREYSEHLAQNGTLSGGPARIHPDVEQIIPGQMPSATR